VPLITDDIMEARAAYTALELRTAAAELNVAVLRERIHTLAAAQQAIADQNGVLKDIAISQVSANAQLLASQASQVSPDSPLDGFIAALGLAVALGEASMSDRTIGSVQASVQSYLTLTTAPEGVAKIIGLRTYQPEFGVPTTLATASFELSKVSPAPGTQVPRNLYAILLEKQAVFTDPFWVQFAAGTPPVQPASQIVAEIATIFAEVGAWSMPFLVREAEQIASFEGRLAGLVGPAPSQLVAIFTTTVRALAAQVKALDPATRTQFVAGDLHALASALDATTRIANLLKP
jgi:hypothetical protein